MERHIVVWHIVVWQVVVRRVMGWHVMVGALMVGHELVWNVVVEHVLERAVVVRHVLVWDVLVWDELVGPVVVGSRLGRRAPLGLSTGRSGSGVSTKSRRDRPRQRSLGGFGSLPIRSSTVTAISISDTGVALTETSMPGPVASSKATKIR